MSKTQHIQKGKAIRSLISLFVLVSITLMVTGCAGVYSPLGQGGIVTSVTSPITATSNEGASKMGRSSAVNVLGAVAVGDASIEAAARNGGITQIHHVDCKSYSFLTFYSKFTTIVYGE